MKDVQLPVKEEVFLATTALEEFWDTSKPILFLGEWCLLYGRRSFWEPLQGQVLSSPFDSGDTAHAAYRYINAIYERLLPILGETLNTIHGTNHSQRYWRIVIGPWLQLYLPVIYDRYSHIKCALEKHPDFSTLVLSDSSFVVAADTLGFACYIKEDAFNLQIYTKILSALGRTFPCRTSQIKENWLYSKLSRKSLKSNLLGWITQSYLNIATKLSRPIFLKSTYFSRIVETRFLLRTLGGVMPVVEKLNKQPEPVAKINNAIRKNLPNIGLVEDEFERCLSAMLFADMPMCFVENFHEVSRDAQNVYPKFPKAVFSANSWYYEEKFKQWAAKSAEKGALLIGTPHGGSYGGLLDMPSENHEVAIVDRYYSWGWTRTDCAAKVIPFPASKLVGRQKIGASNLKVGILWAATSSSRYLLQFPSLPKFFYDYIAWQGRFAKTLNSQLVLVARLRPHREDDGWGIIPRIKECVPSIGIETWDIPFQESLTNCRLYVCDHFSTTFAEALAANKPTILFWDNQANELRSEAQPYYDLLRKVGILFDSPERAGEAVNQVYDDVESWWNDPERKNAVLIFCERFARNSPDAIKLWVDEFKRIEATPELKSASLAD